MSGAQHVNHQTLASLREVMEGDFNQLIETFLSDSKTRMASMQHALAAGDAEQLRRAAHSLKGSCSNMGAAVLMIMCKHIETTAAEGDLTGLERALIELQREFNQVKSQLEVY